MTILLIIASGLLWYIAGVGSMLALYLKQNKGELSLSELVNGLCLGVFGILLVIGIGVGALVNKFNSWHSRAKYKIIYRTKSAKVYELLFGKKDK